MCGLFVCPAVCECVVCVGIGVVSTLSFVFQELPDYGGDTESDRGGNDRAAERSWWAATSFQEGIPPVVEKRAQPKFQPVERVRGAMKVDAAVRVTFIELEQDALKVAVDGKPQDGQQWCTHMHQVHGLSLQKGLSEASHPTLFLELPQDPSGGNPTPDKIKYVKELCSRHRGEAIEVCRSTWTLHAQGPPHADSIHTQLLLGSEVEPASGGFRNTVIQTMAEFGAQVVFSEGGHRPDWKNMKSRWITPDCISTAHHWQRSCKVITLSMLFSKLGNRWSARALYDFYMSQRIVVLKIKRDAGPQRSTRQFLAQETNHIIPELCKALGLKVPENTASLKEYIASMTLAAFAPPWLNRQPIEQRPGQGTSPSNQWMILRHSMLQVPWDSLPTRVQATLTVGTNSRPLVTGAVGFPLLRCAALRIVQSPGGNQQSASGDSVLPCGRVLTMTPLWQCVLDGKPLKNWLCHRCHADQLASGSQPSDSGTRVLVMWPLVQHMMTKGSRPVQVVLDAPPDGWMWGEHCHSSSANLLNKPLAEKWDWSQCSPGQSTRCLLSAEESELVWNSSSRFQ